MLTWYDFQFIVIFFLILIKVVSAWYDFSVMKLYQTDTTSKLHHFNFEDKIAPFWCLCHPFAGTISIGVCHAQDKQHSEVS